MPGGSQIYGIAQLITVLVLFVIILVMAYFVSKWVGGFQKARGSGGNIGVIESYRLGPTRLIALIRIGKRYFAVAMGKDEMSLISEISEDELTFRAQGDAGGTGFKELFDRIRQEKQKE